MLAESACCFFCLVMLIEKRKTDCRILSVWFIKQKTTQCTLGCNLIFQSSHFNSECGSWQHRASIPATLKLTLSSANSTTLKLICTCPGHPATATMPESTSQHLHVHANLPCSHTIQQTQRPKPNTQSESMTPLTLTNSTTLKPIVHSPWTPACYYKNI